MFRRTFFALAAATMVSAPAFAENHSMDIVDTAVNAGSFETLVAAVQAAGLVDTLKGAGPFTVFAPTDEAFAALPAGTVESLLEPGNKDQLVSILTYHVVPAKVMSEELAGQTVSATTVNGGKLMIDARDGVKVNEANVVQADIEASNGVIHVVDAVILPEG
ncbi:fasciclin domain-containing protein [Tropicimonas isoalkanivorans]|uniref:Uncaracterized surface protein containing fasciclin (FAS1) repeats n=1 Tax=Tropicimonas isoalkanivorans TaxID=441112 RepID=A0A1I1RJT5_9RHOB|nr:fasciclin domain-containing protein [Tropicimonas isoalkanivorans]SFD32578.1 Uncaracterized surface protein containing fasciclin (FAS1) repeats [Tropicimonas isoalkanivorans]